MGGELGTFAEGGDAAGDEEDGGGVEKDDVAGWTGVSGEDRAEDGLVFFGAAAGEGGVAAGEAGVFGREAEVGDGGSLHHGGEGGAAEGEFVEAVAGRCAVALRRCAVDDKGVKHGAAGGEGFRNLGDGLR